MILIIIPACDEEKRIGRTLEEYGRFFVNMPVEILVVINNTTDKTEEIIRRAMQKYSNIKYLNFKQGGKGFAIIEGFKEALAKKSELIGFVDADMSITPQAFYCLIKNIKNYDGIIASRRIKGARVKKILKRKVISAVFNFVVRSLFLLPYQDSQCGAKLFKRKPIEKVIDKLTQKGWIFDVDLLYMLKKEKFKIKEYPTIWEDKEGSKIKSFVKTVIETFRDLIKLRFKT